MQKNYGIVKIAANFHQTIIVATDFFNNVIAWNSTSFDNKKDAPVFSYNASKELAIKLKALGIEIVNVEFKGPGQGMEAAIRALMDNGIIIYMIKDKTPIPHNGIYPIKRERKKPISLK